MLNRSTLFDLVSISMRFEEAYRVLFGRTVEGMDIEITVWSANATTPPQPALPVETVSDTRPARSQGQRRMFDPALGHAVDTFVVWRDDL